MPESVDDVLAKIKKASASDFLVKEPEIKSMPTGMAGRIGESKTFNESLKNAELMKGTIPATASGLPPKNAPTIPDKRLTLTMILKNYGMDSMQQLKAHAEILALFGE